LIVLSSPPLRIARVYGSSSYCLLAYCLKPASVVPFDTPRLSPFSQPNSLPDQAFSCERASPPRAFLPSTAGFRNPLPSSEILGPLFYASTRLRRGPFRLSFRGPPARRGLVLTFLQAPHLLEVSASTAFPPSCMYLPACPSGMLPVFLPVSLSFFQ